MTTIKPMDAAQAIHALCSEARSANRESSVGAIDNRCLVHVPDPFRPLSDRRPCPIALAELLSDADIEHVRRTAFRLQSEWFRHNDRDFSQWKGESLGRMVAGPVLRNALHGALSNYTACLELLRRRPGTTHIDVRSDPGIVPEIWAHECHRRGIRFGPIVDDVHETSPKGLRRRPVHQRLNRLLVRVARTCSVSGAMILESKQRRDRYRSLTFALRRFMPRRQHGAWRRRTASRPLAMLVCGSLTLRHAEFCESLERSERIDVVRNTNVMSAGQRRTIHRRTIDAASTHFAGLWDDLERELQHGPMPGGVTQGGRAHVISVLRDTFLNRLPDVAATVEVARETLAVRRPTLLIAEAQPGNDDYVWSSVARSHGVPVVSISNELWGLPIHAYNFPPALDYVLLSSPLSRSWWREKGFREDALLPVRSRYLDTPMRDGRERDTFVALCAVTRYGPDLMDVPATHWRCFVKQILSVARTRPEIQFIVKFHPGTPRLEGHASFARQLAFVKQHAPSNVEVAPLDSALSPYLRRADCLLCSSSSFTIFEALAHRVPCILAPPKSAILDQCPFFRAMKSHSCVTDLENLAPSLDSVLRDRHEIPADWFEGVLYSEPSPSEVVERLAADIYGVVDHDRDAA